jgi:hypothetical protein
MGLNWGGSTNPWKSAHVIATIILGVVGLILFVLWDTFMKLKEPFVPMHLFRNTPWIAATVVSGLCASIYYAFAIVWPQMVLIVWTDSNHPLNSAWLSALVGLLIVIGEIAGGLSAKQIGPIKYQCVISMLLGGIFLWP